MSIFYRGQRLYQRTLYQREEAEGGRDLDHPSARGVSPKLWILILTIRIRISDAIDSEVKNILVVGVLIGLFWASWVFLAAVAGYFPFISED